MDPAIRWQARLKRRTLVVAGLFGLWAIAIEARLVYLQIISHRDLVARADLQQQRRLTAPGKRGDILDRGGRVLATSVDVDSIYAVPSAIADASRAAAAARFASLLDTTATRAPSAAKARAQA